MGCLGYVARDTEEMWPQLQGNPDGPSEKAPGLSPLHVPTVLCPGAHRWGSRLSKMARNSGRCFTKSVAKEEKVGRFESARISRQARSDSQSGAGFSVLTWMEPPDRR